MIAKQRSVSSLGTVTAAIVLALIFQLPAWSSEHYQLFRFDLGATGLFTPRSVGWGLGVYLEPNFTILDSFILGVRIDGSFISLGEEKNTYLGPPVFTTAFQVKCNYYFIDGTFRPYVGLSMGAYLVADDGSPATQEDTSGTRGPWISDPAGNYFIVAPQIGIQLGPVRLAITYNALIGANIKVYQWYGPTHLRPDILNTLTIEVGSWFGGNRI